MKITFEINRNNVKAPEIEKIFMKINKYLNRCTSHHFTRTSRKNARTSDHFQYGSFTLKKLIKNEILKQYIYIYNKTIQNNESKYILLKISILKSKYFKNLLNNLICPICPKFWSKIRNFGKFFSKKNSKGIR